MKNKITMKKIYFTLGLAATLTLSSCSDFLDRDPSTSLPTDDAITSLDDLHNAVNGIGYLLTQDRMTYPAEFGLYADLMGGQFSIVYDMGQSTPITKFTLTKHDDLPDQGYYFFYKALANVNMALANLDKITVSSEKEQATLDDYHGQLLAWRGLLHFDLARMFCQIPTAAADVNAENTGLVLSTEVYEPAYKGTRSTLQETYEQIVKDFTDALPLLEAGGKKHKDGFLSYWAALGLRARAYLYMGMNDEALADAKEVIEQGKYTLYTRDNYATVWGQEFTSESIFELKTTANYNPQRNAIGYFTDATGYPECGFNEMGDLYLYLSTTPTDVRSSMIKDQKDINPNLGKPGVYPGKYPGREGSLYVNNPKIIRLSEVYLIAAEADLKANGKGASYINDLRRNRIDGYVDVESVTLDDILTERQRELFAENHGAFDYWRNKQSIFNSTLEDPEVKYDDYRTILPIPQSEIEQNKGLVQNPEY